MRQFVALFRLLRDEVRGFWATPACSPFKTQMETLLNILMADSRLRQVGLPLVASATDALVRPAGVSAADVSTNAEFVKASIPEVMTAGRQHLGMAKEVASSGIRLLETFHGTPQYGTLRAFADSLLSDLAEQEPAIPELTQLLRHAWPVLRAHTGFKVWLDRARATWESLMATSPTEPQPLAKVLSSGLGLLQDLKAFLADLSDALRLQEIGDAGSHITTWMAAHPDLHHVKDSAKAVGKCAWDQAAPVWRTVPAYLMDLGRSQLKDIQLLPIKSPGFEVWDLTLKEVTFQEHDVHFAVREEGIELIVDAFVATISRFHWRASMKDIQADGGTGEVQPVRGSFRVNIPVSSQAPAPAAVQLQPVELSIQKPANSWIPSFVYNKATTLFADNISKMLQDSISDVLTRRATEVSRQIAPQLEALYPLLVRLYHFYRDPRGNAATLIREIVKQPPGAPESQRRPPPAAAGGRPTGGHSSSISSSPAPAPNAPAAALLPPAASADERKAPLLAMGFSSDVVDRALQRHPVAPVRELIDLLLAS